MKRIIFTHKKDGGKVNTLVWSSFGTDYHCMKCDKDIPADEVSVTYEEIEESNRGHSNENI